LASDTQRLAQAVEKLADQLKDDLRDIDRVLDHFHDRLRDVVENLERIETRLRRQDVDRLNGGSNTGPIPIPIRDNQSQPMALRAPTEDTNPGIKPIPYDDGPSGITADREKIVLRWEFLGTIWTWGRWVLLPALGAGGHYIVELIRHLK
jgi:hypothetical protein